MQPRVTVALATVWFTVAGLVGGTVTLRLSNDQYSPVSPQRYAELQQDQTRDWRAHGLAEDQPLDLWIGSRRSISAEELNTLRHNAKFVKEQDFSLEKPLKDIVSSKQVYSLSSLQRRLPNIATTEFAADKVDYGYEMPETLSREAMIPRSDLLNDPFVADDTFQDQGPGSMEIYKLDLSKEKTLLTAITPPTNLLSTNILSNKSKAPKKTGHLNLKTKTTEIKSTTTDPKIHHRQSNFFEEQRTETSSINRDAFGVGGVPELQVGCEGLEASLSSHKAKRSIDTPDKEEEVAVPASVLLDVMPISLDLDDLSYDEENYEEMDELFKLKKLESAAKKNKPKRGDMDASHLNSDHLDESMRSEKLPIRGDLGKSISRNSRGLEIDREKSRKSKDLEIKKEIKTKRALILSNDAIGHGPLLWLAEANTEGFADRKVERKRARRSADWGFGENEGVVSSNELQTVNERRRQHEMRYYQDISRRRDQHHGINPDVDNIRREYENLLEQKRREKEEEELRQMQQGGRKTLSRWEEEERRRDEMRRTQYDKYRKINHTSTPRIDEETRRRQLEERQRQEIMHNRTQEMARRKEEEQRREEEEQRRRLQEEETRKKSYNKWKEENIRRSESKTPASTEERRLYNEEIRRREEERQRQLQEEIKRQEQYRSQQESQKRKKEEERRRQEDRARNLSEDDRRRLEQRHREWSEKRRQQEEDETRRQQPPSNLMRPEHRISHPNDIRQRDRDEERRMREQEEKRREQKLREYIARNQPIIVTHADRKSKEKRQRYRPEESRDPRINAKKNDQEYRENEQRRRLEEERKLQDYIRRNQPVTVPSRSNQSSVTDRSHNLFEQRRLIEEARRRDPNRYPDLGARRHHGPSAPAYNIDRRGSSEEIRQRQQETQRRLAEERRQRYEAEERRKELARRQREEEERRLREEEARKTQSRRYEEERKRLEAIRLQAEKTRQQMLKERSKSEVGRTRQPEATRLPYYQDPRFLAEYRRRQDSQPIPNNLVQDAEARRVAAEREKQRLEAERRRQDASRMREYKPKETDQWRRQELVRLNSLPVSARIIVVGPGSSSPVSPVVISRLGFDNEIDFTGINPHREGIQAPKFPVPPTSRPPAQNPGPCVWAIVQCCSPNNNRLVKCFESMGCPGVNWDPNPCRGTIADAARTEVMKFYANASNQ